MNTNKRGLLLTSAVLLLLALFARAGVTVNEACYNGSTYPDEKGNTPDWIEVYNSGPSAVNLLNYKLTDSGEGGTWPATPSSPYVTLPSYTLPVGGFLVIYADGTDTVTWTNAPDTVAIPLNSLWKHTTDATGSSAPDPLWKGSTFTESGWSDGMSPLGYNDPKDDLDCATVLPYGSSSSRYAAAYFRKAFTIRSQGTVTGLLVRARLNDGAVLYIDGAEVHRFNMPVGAVSHATPASANTAPEQWQTFTLPPIAQGPHILAVEVHRAAAGGPDLTFDLSLTVLASGLIPFIHAPFKLGEGEKIHLYDNTGKRLLKFNDNNMAHPDGSSIGMPADGNSTEGAEVIHTPPTPGFSNTDATPPPYTTRDDITPPAFSIPSGVYPTASCSMTLTATSGFTVYYTTDGSDPRTSATRAFVFSGNSILLGPPAATVSGAAWQRTNPMELSAVLSDAAWSAPLEPVPRVVVLRAVANNASTPTVYSTETHGTYLVGTAFNTGRTLPIISLITDADNLFGFTGGIYVPGKAYADSPEGYGSNKWGKPYANYHQANDNQRWERPARFELFEPAQTAAAVSMRLGVAMYGGGTRTLPQKTLYLMARLGEYGASLIDCPLFPDEAAASYKRFLLRNNGNDWYGPMSAGISTMMKDAVFHRIVKNLDISVMAYRPAIVYINGEYWGLHNMRESFDKHYLATRYGLDPDNMDILMHEESSADKDKVHIARVDGDTNSDEEYEDLIDWIQANPLSAEPNYQQAQAWIDITNHTDYIIAETFFANTDWPINNCDFWRAHTNQTATCGKYGDGRWRWMFYDLDLAGEKGADFNMFTYLSSNKMTGGSEPGFLINQLWANMTFRNHFVTRYANLLNTTFRPERTADIITQAADMIAPEIERHFRRWGRPFVQAQWRQAVTHVLTDYTAARHGHSWGHLDTHFGLGGTGTVTVRNADPSGTGGSFIVNGIAITTATEGVTNRAEWSGTFFRSLPVPVVAVPDAGYVFDGWAGTAIVNPAPDLFLGGAPVTLTARFRLSGAAATPPTAYETWALENYSTNDILATEAAAPSASSGIAGYSNYAVFALGASRFETTPEQLAARSLLSIAHRADGLWVSHFRTPAPYTLLSATSLVDVVWLPYTPLQTVTNPAAIDHHTAPATPARFFKWSIPVP